MKASDKYFVRVDSIYKKIIQAEKEDRVLYAYGVSGIGKTTAVSHYYISRPHIILSGLGEEIKNPPPIEELSEKTVIFDDISLIDDQSVKDYICRVLRSHVCHVVLISRAMVPDWLADIEIDDDFLISPTEDFLFDKNTTIKLLEKYEIKLTSTEIDFLLKSTLGWALALTYACRSCKAGMIINDNLKNQVSHMLYNYLDNSILSHWDSECQDTILKVAYPETFDIELIKLVCDVSNPEAVLDKLYSYGSYMTWNPDNSYSIIVFFKEYLQHKFKLAYNEAERKEYFMKLAKYYENDKKNTYQAVRFYDMAGSEADVLRLLEKDSILHPQHGSFYELRKYYLKLTDEQIRSSPQLMTGVSFVYCILLMPDKSTYWYEQLSIYFNKLSRSDPSRKEVRQYLSHLNYVLSHKGAHNMITLLKDSSVLMKSGELNPMDISTTTHLPSLLNSGLDFAEWTRNDKAIARILGGIIETVMGKNAVGLVDVAIAESQMEKGAMDGYEVLTLLNRGLFKAQTNGTIDTCFAAIGVITRQYIFWGNWEKAWRTLEDFHQSLATEDIKDIKRNLRAHEIWLQLLNGNTVVPKDWLNSLPANEDDFCTMFRYQYLMEIRVYLALDQIPEALALTEKMDFYTMRYERHCMRIQVLMLKAIGRYYKHAGGDEAEWLVPLTEALAIAQKYHFIHYASEEGASLLPLLQALHKKYSSARDKKTLKNKAFLEEVIKEASAMADFYPNYLSMSIPMDIHLTARELEILRELCKGTSTDDICSKFNISYAGLKYHNKNIYKKLGVKNRREAEKVAESSGLLL